MRGRVEGRPSGDDRRERPAPSRLASSAPKRPEVSGRDERLTEPDVEVDRAGRAAARRRDRPADRPTGRAAASPAPRRATAARSTSERGRRRSAPGRWSAGRLGRAARAAGRPSGARADARQRRLDDRRQQFRDGGPRRHDDRDRPPRGAGQTEREEPGRALVEQHADAQTRVGARRRGPAAWSASPGRRRRRVTPALTSSWAIAAQREDVRHGRVLRRRRRAPAIIVRSLSRDSSHSRAGSESATIPQPANSVASRPGDEAAAERDHQLAVAIGAEPADRAGVPAAIEVLVLGDEAERDVARRRRRPRASGAAGRPGRAARPRRAASR